MEEWPCDLLGLTRLQAAEHSRMRVSIVMCRNRARPSSPGRSIVTVNMFDEISQSVDITREGTTESR